MKVPLIYKRTPTEAAAALDRSLREQHTCLGLALGFPLGSAACFDLSCSECVLHNPHGAATVGSMALKIVIAETYVSKHAQAQPDQYMDLKDILPLLKPQREPS